MAKKSSSAARRPASRRRVVTDRVYRVLVEMSPHEKVTNLGRYGLQYACMTQPRPTETGARDVHGFARGATIAALRRTGRRVKVLADAVAEGKRLRRFIGKGDRFRGGRSGPPGSGKLV